MDQTAWNEIYSDLESDIADLTSRGATVDPQIYIDIDRARFAIDRGDNSAAIGIIQHLRGLLGLGAKAATRGPSAMPTFDRLDALEERLHTEARLGSCQLEMVGEEEEEAPVTRAASRNTKVNKSIKYEDISGELEKMFETAEIRDNKRAAVKAEATRLLQGREVYEEISDATKVPWWFIGLIHGMECSYSMNKHLHNGDSLKARTWQVPAGRPKKGSPPFTFKESAIDALEVDGFAGKTDWPLPMVLFRLERYNGFGYRKKFGFASPYLWSYTNHFESGKYVRDGVFDADAPSKQCGTAATLKELIERALVSFEEKPAAVAAAPKPAPAAPPAPTPVAPAPAPAPASPAPAAPAAAAAPKPEPVVAPAPAATPAPAPAAPAAPPAGVSPAVADALAAMVESSKPAATSAPPPAAAAAPSPPEAAASRAPVVSALAAVAKAAAGSDKPKPG